MWSSCPTMGQYMLYWSKHAVDMWCAAAGDHPATHSGAVHGVSCCTCICSYQLQFCCSPAADDCLHVPGTGSGPSCLLCVNVSTSIIWNCCLRILTLSYCIGWYCWDPRPVTLMLWHHLAETIYLHDYLLLPANRLACLLFCSHALGLVCHIHQLNIL